MTGRQLEDLLHGLEDTHEVVITRAPEGDVALAVWRTAEEEADIALVSWQLEGGGDAYAAYVAAVDRADAAAEALAARFASR
jgi:hypothetical protein